METAGFKQNNRVLSFLGHILGESVNAKNLEESVPGIMSSSMLRMELEREMLRSDRNETPLTLLIFSIYNAAGKLIQDEAELIRLAKSLNQCTRRTDLKGWFSSREGMHVALMLHNTPYEKAERILGCVREQFVLSMLETQNVNKQEPHVDCSLYGYPVSSSSEEGRYEQLRLFDDESLLDLQGEETPQNGSTGENAASMEESNRISREAIHSIEELLAAPLPWWKRAIDIVVSLSALLLLSPLLAIIAVLVKFSSPGKVIFKQQRVGHSGKIFWLWKFRSMHTNADTMPHKKYLSQLINGNKKEEKPMRKLDAGDSQITPIGRILRISCMDELPQLVNVLRGEMSLVGPRPCLPYEAKEYLLWHHRRFDTIPGLTGLWQVSGKNKTTFRQMIRLDIQYSTHRSFVLDMKILLKTIPAIINQVREEFGGSKVSQKAVMEMDQA